MNCPRCGSLTMPNGRFCGACGFRLSDAPAGGDAGEASNSRRGASSSSPPNVSFDPDQTIVRSTSPERETNSFAPDDEAQASPSFQAESQVNNMNNPSFGQGGIHIDADSRGQGRGYSYQILHQPSFALAVLRLEAEQSIQAEAGAMVSMSGNIELQSQMKGGVFGALKRAVGGESAFVSTFTARGAAGEVTLAPGSPGDIAGVEMTNQDFLVQSSSYLAGDTSLQVDTTWGGARSFFGGEGLFVLRVKGTGLLLVSSFGAIHRKVLQPGERYVVDTGHLVAWEAAMPYTLRKAASGFFRSFISGEGIVSEFTGPGELLIQTRNLEAFAGMLRPFFPTQGSGGGFNFDIRR